MLDAIERTALRVLTETLGVRRALSVGIAVQWRMLRGEPFAALPRPTDAREHGSRAQAGPAIVLYRVLSARLDPTEALRVVAAVVEASALVFLARSLGALRREEIAALDAAGREQFAKQRADRFPNALLTWDEISTERVRFTVTRCRLIELVQIAGHPELGPLFCRGDGRYFSEVEPGVRLIRPTTIAGGHDTCAFTLQWSDREEIE